MNSNEKLALIIEAILYCKKVRSMGMPKSCYTKALREPIYFLWEKKPRSSKYASSTYRSVAAMSIANRSGDLVYDHAIPFTYILEQLLSLEAVNVHTVSACLELNLVSCTITKNENDMLNAAGLSSKMPVDWDGKDVLARYKSVGIEVHRQPASIISSECSWAGAH